MTIKDGRNGKKKPSNSLKSPRRTISQKKKENRSDGLKMPSNWISHLFHQLKKQNHYNLIK